MSGRRRSDTDRNDSAQGDVGRSTREGPHSGRRGVVGGLLVTLVLVGLTTGLGIWQVKRLAWKQHILAQVSAAERSPPVALPAHPVQFQKVEVSGTLDPAGALSYADIVRDGPDGAPVEGTELVEPLLRPGKPDLLVVLGWTRFPPRPVAGHVAITGYVRLPEHRSWLIPHDYPGERRIYTLDPATIGREFGLPAVAPFTLVALGPHADPDPQQSLPRPPNNHLQYAITWFSLSFIGLAMFGSWLWRGRPD